MARITRIGVLAAAALASAPLNRARADEGPLIGKGLGSWSVVGAEVDSAKPVIDVQAGWPSTTFGYTFALSRTSDIGIRLGLLYGYEGTTATQFGLSLYFPLRFELPGNRDVHWLFHVDPGLKIYTEETAAFGFQFPIGIVVGFPVRHGLEVGLGIDFNMTLLVTGVASPRFIFGPMVGPYVEYHLQPNVSLGLNTRFGAAIQAENQPVGTFTDFAFVTQLFLGYRL